MTAELVIKGGRVVDAARRARGRRGRRRRRIVAIGPDLSGDAHDRRGGLRRVARAGRPAQPPAPAGPGGGGDHRDRRPGRGARWLHLHPRHAEHDPRDRPRRHRARGPRARPVGAVRRPHLRCHHGRAAGRAARPLAEMAELGVRFFTDDGAGVADARLMRRAMEYAGGLKSGGAPVVLAQHCEDPVLAGGGHMHEGEWSSRLGIPGQPAESEELMVMRDLALARLTGTPVHFQHLSTARLDRDGPRRPRRPGSTSPARPPRTTSRSPMPSARRTTRCSR